MLMIAIKNKHGSGTTVYQFSNGYGEYGTKFSYTYNVTENAYYSAYCGFDSYETDVINSYIYVNNTLKASNGGIHHFGRARCI